MPQDQEKLKLNCPRCQQPMRYWRKKDMSTNAGSLLFYDEGPELELYVCPQCRHVELFAADSEPLPSITPLDKNAPPPPLVYTDGGLIKCPQCGKEHSRTDPACPLCGLSLETLEGLYPSPDVEPAEAGEPEPAPPEEPKKPLFRFGKDRRHKDPWE